MAMGKTAKGSKSFAAAPTPKRPVDPVEEYERGGAGHDQRREPSEPLKRLSVDLPESLHWRFKTACSATRRKMVDEVAALIEQRVAELEAEAGIHKP